MEKLTLKNPIMIDGKEVTELSHDANEINGMLFATAESKKATRLFCLCQLSGISWRK